MTLTALVMVASLGLNVGILAFSTVAAKAGLVFDAVTGVTSTFTDLQKKAAVKDARIVSLTDEVASLKKGPSVTYRGEKRLVKEAVGDTAERVSKRTAIAATRNAGSIVAEAIPYLGIAAIIGVTAWDLKDSCDTMIDLHELDLTFNPDKALDPEATEVCGMKLPSSEEVWADVKTNAADYWRRASDYLPDLPDFEWPSLSDLVFWD
ncbi:hypothetical protein OE699_14710 [Sedimentimonas flavescens]|uniref:Uncharacterized protein n=1 Tax=Sedimentimonas flavescens TaxID=2851012 RepID=A0ABT3A279_9RHOB|nr:hypothetical protein [Sedimentimonas flavescens]MCV2880099.1 hypothetical protein [Sedimentimonas flavescens]